MFNGLFLPLPALTIGWPMAREEVDQLHATRARRRRRACRRRPAARPRRAGRRRWSRRPRRSSSPGACRAPSWRAPISAPTAGLPVASMTTSISPSSSRVETSLVTAILPVLDGPVQRVGRGGLARPVVAAVGDLAPPARRAAGSARRSRRSRCRACARPARRCRSPSRRSLPGRCEWGGRFRHARRGPSRRPVGATLVGKSFPPVDLRRRYSNICDTVNDRVQETNGTRERVDPALHKEIPVDLAWSLNIR